VTVPLTEKCGVNSLSKPARNSCVTGGLALTGVRPIAHTFGAFLIERPFEQVKLDLGHQDVGAILVSAGGSYGWPGGGETHFGHRDVALLDTLAGWTVHVPGHPDEAVRR